MIYDIYVMEKGKKTVACNSCNRIDCVCAFGTHMVSIVNEGSSPRHVVRQRAAKAEKGLKVMSVLHVFYLRRKRFLHSFDCTLNRSQLRSFASVTAFLPAFVHRRPNNEHVRFPVDALLFLLFFDAHQTRHSARDHCTCFVMCIGQIEANV